MATRRQTEDETYRCPECDGALSVVDRAWQCEDCRYVPPHGAD